MALKNLEPKHSLLLFNLYNMEVPDSELNYHFLMRQCQIIVEKTNKLKVGNNILVNRLSLLNNSIPLEWFNLKYTAFKLNAKGLFLCSLVKSKLMCHRYFYFIYHLRFQPWCILELINFKQTILKWGFYIEFVHWHWMKMPQRATAAEHYL